jgi:hypothetical protein
MENKYQKINNDLIVLRKNFQSQNDVLIREILNNPTTDISSLSWERISMKLATLINTAKQIKSAEDSMLFNRIIDAQKSNQVLDFGTPVFVNETNRFGIVTFIDKDDKCVYLDNDEAPICQLDENNETDVIRLATQEEILVVKNSNKAQQNEEDSQNND